VDKLKKNNAFEFYRFLFACVVFFLHFRGYGGFKSPNGAFNGGYLAVEFFFILSGFLMMGKVERDCQAVAEGASAETLTVGYFFSRYKKLMPPYWLSIVVLFLVHIIVMPDFNIKSNLLKALPEFFGVQMFWRPGGINGHLWYVSALLWAGSLAYYLLLKYKDSMLNIVFPFGLLTAIGYIYQKVGHIDLPLNDLLFFGPFFRAFFEIGFGCVLYNVYIRLCRTPPQVSVVSKGLQTLAEILLLAVIIIVMWRTRRDHKDFLMIFLLGGLILVTALGQGSLSRLLNNNLSAVLGGISYDVYINQYIFQRIAYSKFPGLPYWPTAIALLALTIVYSVFSSALLRKIVRRKGKEEAGV